MVSVTSSRLLARGPKPRRLPPSLGRASVVLSPVVLPNEAGVPLPGGAPWGLEIGRREPGGARASLRLQGTEEGAPGQDPHLLSAPTLPGTPTPFRRLPSPWTGCNLEKALHAE